MHQPLDWLDRKIGLQQRAGNSTQSGKIEYGLFGFTPENITLAEPQQNDRPYAGLVYVASTREHYQPMSNVSWQSTLTLGILGLDIVGELQKGVHSITGSDQPRGWDNQISEGGELTARYSVARQHLLYRSGSGLEAAIEMAGVANRVYLVSAGDLSGDAILQDKVTADARIEVLTHYRPAAIHGDDRVTGLTVENPGSGESRHLQVDGVFIEIGLSPNSDFALDLLEANHRGEIEVDGKGHTGIQGIFAAGDVTDDQSKQIVIAAGSGASAALGAFEYLVSQV